MTALACAIRPPDEDLPELDLWWRATNIPPRACSPAHSNLGLALSLGTELGLGRCAIGSEQLAALERL